MTRTIMYIIFLLYGSDEFFVCFLQNPSQCHFIAKREIRLQIYIYDLHLPDLGGNSSRIVFVSETHDSGFYLDRIFHQLQYIVNLSLLESIVDSVIFLIYISI